MSQGWVHGEAWRMILADLAELREETRNPNWDGFGSPPLTEDVFWFAIQFIRTIPLDIPQPEVGATSSGDISFEWAQTALRIVSLGVSATGEIHYAALNGPRRTFGSFPYDGTFDSQLRSLIVSVLG